MYDRLNSEAAQMMAYQKMAQAQAQAQVDGQGAQDRAYATQAQTGYGSPNGDCANSAAYQTAPPRQPLTDAVLLGFQGALSRVQEAEERVRIIADRLFGQQPQMNAAGAQGLTAVVGSMAQEIDDAAGYLERALRELHEQINRLGAL